MIKRHKWNEQEDKALISMIAGKDEICWESVATKMTIGFQIKTAKQCKER